MWAYCSYIDLKNGKEIKEAARTQVLTKKGYSFDFTRFVDWANRDFALLICRYDHETQQTYIFPTLALVDRAFEDADYSIKELFRTSYCEDSFSEKNLHYMDPLFWNNITDTVATKIGFKGLLEWVPLTKTVSHYGFDLKLKCQYDFPISFLRSFHNKDFFLSTIAQDIEKMVTKIMLDMTVCKELRESPLGRVLNGNDFLNVTMQRVALKHHKQWLKMIQTSKEVFNSISVDASEIAMFTQIKKGLRDNANKTFKDKIGTSISVAGITLKHGYSSVSRAFTFICSFEGIQVFDIPSFIRLLKLTGMYNVISDACSKFILMRA